MIPIQEIIRTKRRSIALVVRPDGSLVVRAPLHTSQEEILALVEKKRDWIRSKQELVKNTYPPYVPKEFVNGEGFWYLGKLYRLAIIDAPSPALTLNEGYFKLSRSALPTAAQTFERWYRQQSAEVLGERMEWFSSRHGFPAARVKITAPTTRWGSCSSQGTLSFSWRLVMAPMPVIDYVVVHELVHMQTRNHSKEFWHKIRLILPDYAERIAWLETNGHLLRVE